MNAPVPFVYLMEPPSLRCAWNDEEQAFQCLFNGFPFDSCLAYVTEAPEGGFLIQSWIEVEESDDSPVLAYALPISREHLHNAEEIAKRLLEAVCFDWFEN